jgi:transcriptional regulator with XRE-family HTH domain
MDVTPMGDIVRSARKAKGLSQSALAEAIDVSHRTIIAVENNQRYPTYEVFHRLVHALDISADSIVFPDHDPFTAERNQFVRELLACGEREQRIAIEMLRSLLRALRHDDPEKQD